VFFLQTTVIRHSIRVACNMLNGAWVATAE